MRPRLAARWQTEFGVWVDNFEVGRLASELDVTPQAVYHWVSGRSLPCPARALTIVHLSAGALTLQDIYVDRPAAMPRRVPEPSRCR